MSGIQRCNSRPTARWIVPVAAEASSAPIQPYCQAINSGGISSSTPGSSTNTGPNCTMSKRTMVQLCSRLLNRLWQTR